MGLKHAAVLYTDMQGWRLPWGMACDVRRSITPVHALCLCSAKAQDKVWTAQDLYYFPTKDEEVYKPEQVTVEGEWQRLGRGRLHKPGRRTRLYGTTHWSEGLSMCR